MKRTFKTICALAMTLGTGVAAQTQGVSDTEVVIGSANDLSGIFAAVGVPAIQGAKLRFKQANDAGGIHGRQIRLVVEDHGYQLPRASQALNKLIHRDRVFANILTLGTPHNLAGFQIMDPKGIFNLSPLTASVQMLNEPVSNKFVSFASYTDQTIAGVEYLIDEKGAQRFCSMYLPTDFGIEIGTATKETAQKHGLTFAAETTHKPDEQDFIGALQKLKAAECDVISIATGVRQTITIVGTAKKMGWSDVDFLVTSAGFLEVVAAVPGGITEGLYAASGYASLAARAAQPGPATFLAEFEAEYGADANGFAMLGYTAAEILVRALEAAGKDLTQDSFRTAIEGLSFRDELLEADVDFSPDNHQGINAVVVSVVENGGWKELARR